MALLVVIAEGTATEFFSSIVHPRESILHARLIILQSHEEPPTDNT